MLGLLLSMLPGLAGKLLEHLNKKADTALQAHIATVEGSTATYKAGVEGDTAINVELIRGYVQAQKAAAEQRAADRGHWSTAWMLPTAFAVSISHYAAVLFDSQPLFGHIIGSWHVSALPPDYATMQQSIILGVAGLTTTKSIAGVVTRVFRK